MTKELKKKLDLILIHNLKHPPESERSLLRIPILIARGEMAIAFQGKPNKDTEKKIWKNGCERLAASLPELEVALDKKKVDPFEGIKKAFPSTRKPETAKLAEIVAEMAKALKSITKMDLGDVDALEMLKLMEENHLVKVGETKAFAKAWGKKDKKKERKSKSAEINGLPL